ncbi:hypothetical protein HDU98_010520 [Podochytrium sp. JEL0797]|nr:hypothetical protein HDU98_010520 [Podochytrium sp. JEL0797]
MRRLSSNHSSFDSLDTVSLLMSPSTKRNVSTATATQQQTAFVRAQHLSRLLAETQETVAVQAKEIGVLKKALVEQSSLLGGSSFASSVTPPADIPTPFPRDSAAENALRTQLATQQKTIDSLALALENAQRDLRAAKDQLSDSETRRKEAEESLAAQTSSLVTQMLVKASDAKPANPPPPKQKKLSENSRLLKHTSSSTAKLKNASKPEPNTNPHSFHPPPKASKHARSHSYDSHLKQIMQERAYDEYLKQIMAQNCDYADLHPRNVDSIRNQARVLNRSCDHGRETVGNVSVDSTRRFKNRSKELKVVTLEEGSMDGCGGGGIHAESLSQTGSLLCENLNDLYWMRLPSSSNASKLKSEPVRYPPTVVVSKAKAAKSPQSSPHQQYNPVVGAKEKLSVEELNARALAAEKERDALEVELLELLKVVNQGNPTSVPLNSFQQ